MAVQKHAQNVSGARTGDQPRSAVVTWLTTVDHKRIGILYLGTSFIFFVLAGLFALVMRVQLAWPNLSIISNKTYDQLFTMHGTSMIFLVGMPMALGLANYIVPLMIGARDMAFPKLNALSYWLYLFAGLFLYASFLVDGAPSNGWFSYAPLTEPRYSPGSGMDFWCLAILMLATSSTLGALNIIVTVSQLRAPGMTLSRIPLFAWMMVFQSTIGIFAFPALMAAAGLLLLDRQVGTHFFKVYEGGSSLLWQHLFWFFGHPEVYILILPAFGIVSEVIPVFSNKRLFSYKIMIVTGGIFVVLSFMVWAHHMFTVGLSNVSLLFFAGSSFLFGIPTGIKIFAWLATMWGGQIRFTTPMLFCLGLLVTFTMGGITGVHVAVVPFDQQVHDTYYVVAHFHYVLFGGTIFGLFAGLYYWFPKMTGRLLDERLGKWNFWLMFVGMNMLYFPMHLLGIMGMPRRIYTYPDEPGWGELNLLSTVGGMVIGVAIIIFLANFVITMRKPAHAKGDPWDGNTLEWMTSSPPPEYNFARIPVVESPRPQWDKKHPTVSDRVQKEH